MSLSLLILMFSCNDNENIRKWINRQIIFPKSMPFTIYSKDTVMYDIQKQYKIMTYVSSDDCTPCVLKLSGWRDFMKEIDSISSKSVSYLFVVHPKNRIDLINHQRSYSFNFPMFVDNEDSVNILNEFSENSLLRTFLLDKDDRVILIGNPILNPNVCKLYTDYMKRQYKK